MLLQQSLCLPVVLTLVLYLTDAVRVEMYVNCGPDAVVGEPYKIQCTNIPATPTNGINIFLGNTSNSIIFCLSTDPKNCYSRKPLLYNVTSPHDDSLYFTILSVTTDDIGKKVYCVDDATLDLSSPKPNCTIEPPRSTTESTTISMIDVTGPLSVGAIVAIVVGCIGVICITIIVICVCWKKKCYCFADKHLEKQKKKETGQEGTALQENPPDNITNN